MDREHEELFYFESTGKDLVQISGVSEFLSLQFNNSLFMTEV